MLYSFDNGTITRAIASDSICTPGRQPENSRTIRTATIEQTLGRPDALGRRPSGNVPEWCLHLAKVSDGTRRLSIGVQPFLSGRRSRIYDAQLRRGRCGGWRACPRIVLPTNFGPLVDIFSPKYEIRLRRGARSPGCDKFRRDEFARAPVPRSRGTRAQEGQRSERSTVDAAPAISIVFRTTITL